MGLRSQRKRQRRNDRQFTQVPVTQHHHCLRSQEIGCIHEGFTFNGFGVLNAARAFLS
jgi:hypothetical protein